MSSKLESWKPKKMLSKFTITQLKSSPAAPNSLFLHQRDCFYKFGYTARNSTVHKLRLKLVAQSLGDKWKLSDIDTSKPCFFFTVTWYIFFVVCLFSCRIVVLLCLFFFFFKLLSWHLYIIFGMISLAVVQIRREKKSKIIVGKDDKNCA